MGRKSTIWNRKGRGYWSTINRRQRFLGHNLKEAREKLKVLLAQSRPTTVGQFTVAQLVTLYLAELSRKAAKNERSIHTHGAARSYLDRWAEACRRVRPEMATSRAATLPMLRGRRVANQKSIATRSLDFCRAILPRLRSAVSTYSSLSSHP